MQTPAEAALSNQTTGQPTQGKPLWRGLLETLIAIGLVLFLAQALFSIVTIEGDAMSPTLRAGQVVVVSRAPYLLTPPRRGDVVAMRSRINPSRLLLFRVIGLPSERLNVKGAQVSINNQPLRELYLPDPTDRLGVNATLVDQYQIGRDEFFLMNDNRGNADDSRASGVFTRTDLAGRAWLIVWPPEGIQFVGPTQPARATQA